MTIQLPRRYPPPVRAGSRVRPKLKPFALPLFVVLHAPLGLALKLVPYFSTLHALIALAIAVMLVVKRYPTGWVVAGCAYLVGSETLWRMTHASLFWEFGKYSLVLVMMMSLCLRRPRITSYLPLFYMALLAPAAVLTMLAATDLNYLRQTLSFNLSGPVAYAACALFLFGRNLSLEDMRLVLTAMLAPVAGVAALALFGIETTAFVFGTSSLKATSGGFSPNQVSADLGLGMVVCFLLLACKQGGRVWKGLLLVMLVWFGIHSVLTFSRSGLYYSAAAMLAGTPFLVSDVRRFVSVLALALALLCLGSFVVLPRLDAYTSGAVKARYSDTGLTGRDTLMKNDLNLFLKYPVLGIGVGMGDESRGEARGGDEVHSHTEFTRLLSEHGLLGAAALMLMLIMSVRAVVLQTQNWPKACSASVVVFSLIFMTGSGMRLATPSFLLALAGVRICLPRTNKMIVPRSARRPVINPMPGTSSPMLSLNIVGQKIIHL